MVEISKWSVFLSVIGKSRLERAPFGFRQQHVSSLYKYVCFIAFATYQTLFALSALVYSPNRIMLKQRN